MLHLGLFILMVLYFSSINTDYDEYTQIEILSTSFLFLLIACCIKQSCNLMLLIGMYVFVKVSNEKFRYLMKTRFDDSDNEDNKEILKQRVNSWVYGLIAVFICLLH